MGAKVLKRCFSLLLMLLYTFVVLEVFAVLVDAGVQIAL